MASTSARFLKTRVVFKGPGLQVNGLEAVPEGLWLSDQQDNRTYLVDYEGNVLSSFPSPARNASGTSFGSGSVWIASNVREFATEAGCHADEATVVLCRHAARSCCAHGWHGSRCGCSAGAAAAGR